MTQITLLETSLTTSRVVNLLTGPSTSSACPTKMASNTSGTSLMLPRSGHTATTHSSESESCASTETQKTTSQMSNSQLSAPLTSFPELNPQWTRCFRADCSPTLIPTDTDSETTTIKSQSTAPTELAFLTQIAMDGQSSTATKDQSQTTTPTLSMSTRLDLRLSSANSESLAWLADISQLTPTATLLNQELSSEKS